MKYLILFSGSLEFIPANYYIGFGGYVSGCLYYEFPLGNFAKLLKRGIILIEIKMNKTILYDCPDVLDACVKLAEHKDRVASLEVGQTLPAASHDASWLFWRTETGTFCVRRYGNKELDK